MSAPAFTPHTPQIQPFPAKPLATMQSHQLIATLTNITKRYGTTIALDSLSLSLHPGEVVALLGPNGAGKSTAVKLLLGLIAPTAGTSRVFGSDPRKGHQQGPRHQPGARRRRSSAIVAAAPFAARLAFLGSFCTHFQAR